MAETTIPVPISSGATDQPNAVQSGAVPPPPQGATDTAPANVPPPPAGASDTPPEEQGEDKTGGAGLLQYGENVATGAGKGLSQGLIGAGELGSKLTGGLLDKGAEKIGDLLGLPKLHEGANAYESARSAVGEPQGTDQWVGYGGENLAEFMLGDEALKGMPLADKYKQISGVMAILEKSPRLMRALQMGSDVGKAATELGPEEQAAIKKSPMLARLVGAGMDAIRQGAVQGAQTLTKTGGDVGEAAKSAAATGATSGVLGGAFGMLGRAAEKAGEAGQAVKAASEAGARASSNVEIGQKVASQIQDAETAMHGDFESGIQKLKGDLGDQKVPYQGSPLQKAAQEAMQGKTEAKGVLGGAFQGLAGGTDESKKFLNNLNDPKTAGDMGIDELVRYRQQLGEKIGQVVKGQTTAAERADVAVYQKLRDGIDDTIDALAKNSGKPEASQDYEALRGAYKDKVKLFQSPAIRALSEPGVASDTKLDNASKYLLAGGNKLDKVNTLTQVIGEQGVKDLGQGILKRAFADASTESGQINPAKFVKNFKNIDSLPPEVKDKLFDMDAVNDGLGKLSGDLKSAANYQKLVRGGVLSAVGGGAGSILPHGGIGLLLGTLGAAGDLKGAEQVLDVIANRPAMWGAFRTAGKIGATLEASPAARRVATAAKYGAGNALSNIVSGASAPLSQPEDQDQVVYSNQ